MFRAVSPRRRHRRLLRQANRVGARARGDRGNAAFHRDSPRRQQRVGPISGRLHDRIEVAAGLRDKAARFAPARLPDPVQPVAIGVGRTIGRLVDTPGSPRTDISQFHARLTMRCTRPPARHVIRASCRSRPAPSEPAAATFREGGINCEMCHGPSLRSRRADEGRRHTGVRRCETPISFRRLPAQRYVAVCAQCHAQSAVHDAQPGGAVNYSESGEPFRTYSIELPSAFSRKAFYRDGRYRATTFISEAFARIAVFSQRERDMRIVPRSPSAECGAEPDLAEIRRGCRCDVRAVPHRSCASDPSVTRVTRQAPKRAAVCRATCRASWRRCCFRRDRTRSTTSPMPR